VNDLDVLDSLMRTRPGETPASFERPEWHARAACRGLTELMHAQSGPELARARAVCAGCPVRRECEGEVVPVLHDQGVRAGRTQRERRGRTAR